MWHVGFSTVIALVLASGAGIQGGVDERSEEARPAAGIFREGAPLPELRLPTIDGQEWVELGQLRGRRTFLLQFASW